MAIAGGACTAYQLQRWNETFTVARLTLLRDLCDDPAEAMDRFLQGEAVRISGEHIQAFRRQCEEALHALGRLTQ